MPEPKPTAWKWASMNQRPGRLELAGVGPSGLRRSGQAGLHGGLSQTFVPAPNGTLWVGWVGR